MGSWGRSISIPQKLKLVHATTPSSTLTLDAECRGLLIQTAGLLNITMADGTVLTAVPFIAGLNPGRFGSIQSSTALTPPAANIFEFK